MTSPRRPAVFPTPSSSSGFVARLVVAATGFMVVSLPGFMAVALAAPPSEPGVAKPAPRPAAIADAVARQLAKPSVHHEQRIIERTLTSSGVRPETIHRLFEAVAASNLPGMAGRLDGFLFLTHDPEWLAMRGHFSEFLELPDVASLTVADAVPLKRYGGVVSLPSVVRIDATTAAAVGTFGEDDWGAAIEFPAVGEFDSEVAGVLADCEALLAFPHLERLSPEAARALARHEGIGLVLGGLDRLPADVAAALGRTRSMQGLLLPDLEVLDSEPLARRLSRQDHVFLPRVTALDPAIAKALRGNEGGELALPALAEVTPAVAEQLVGAGYYWLVLGGAPALSAEAAAILARHNGQLTFAGPGCFSAAAAAELARHENTISLPHLAAVPADVARALAPHEGTLELGGLSALPADVAPLLAAHAGGLHLPAVETLSPEVAAALAPRSGTIGLAGLRSLDGPTAAAFATHSRDVLAIGGISELGPAAAAELAAYPGRIALPAVTRLTPAAARALAPHRGELTLESLEDVSPELAVELAKHAGDLELDAVLSLSTASAEALAKAPGRLSLMSLEQLTPEGAAALARRQAPVFVFQLQNVERIDSLPLAELLVASIDDLELGNLQALDGPGATAIARTLAGVRGTLSLPSLERITPQALEALLAKSGVQLPAAEDLELVSDPTAAGNDDFVDPRQ